VELVQYRGLKSKSSGVVLSGAGNPDAKYVLMPVQYRVGGCGLCTPSQTLPFPSFTSYQPPWHAALWRLSSCVRVCVCVCVCVLAVIVC
jgi:hypothetical protein